MKVFIFYALNTHTYTYTYSIHIVYENTCQLNVRAEELHSVVRKLNDTKEYICKVFMSKTCAFFIIIIIKKVWFALKNTIKPKNKWIFLIFLCIGNLYIQKRKYLLIENYNSVYSVFSIAKNSTQFCSSLNALKTALFSLLVVQCSNWWNTHRTKMDTVIFI